MSFKKYINLKDKKKKNILIIFLLIIISILILFTKGCKSKVEIKDGQLKGIIGDGLLPGLTAEEIEKSLQKEADSSMFSFDINTTPTFENGKLEGNVRIANPPYNIYPIGVKIQLNSDKKVIFQSGKIKPNQYIEKCKLNKVLKKGQYPATAQIEAYDPHTGEYLGKTVVKLKIIIRN
ncbi:hypothetical protein [Clostridium tarantellae]|uniref:Uncharacterized protein n=1 Tax=Clostridium tarantellae TaxID=39493 RepID=A0A6I1MPH3_9CLOT|nr:hypothetical protein [Clostridium tarantellae]MPQ44132.1 hypothetical protein [Clostridium tarantellae]